VNSTTRKQHEKEEFCGRPLGLRFHRETGELYVADAYYGLMVIGQSGGVASSIAREADGDLIRFANDLDVHRNGSVFFTDTSMRYSRKRAKQNTLPSPFTFSRVKTPLYFC